MKTNLGTNDRIIRTVIAVMIAILCFTGMIIGLWAIVAMSIAIILVLTSFLRFCPLYKILRINTCKIGKSGSDLLT